MTLNRLIEPASELAMVGWAGRVAVADVLATDVSKLNEDKFYRNLDTLHGKRIEIERELHAREKSLFNLQGQLLLYDLTNTHFEGQVAAVAQGQARAQQADADRLQAGGHEPDAGRRRLPHRP